MWETEKGSGVFNEHHLLLFSRTLGRRVDSSLNRLAILTCHRSPPSGSPRCTPRRSASNSETLSGRFTHHSQFRGRATGHLLNSDLSCALPMARFTDSSSESARRAQPGSPATRCALCSGPPSKVFIRLHGIGFEAPLIHWSGQRSVAMRMPMLGMGHRQPKHRFGEPVIDSRPQQQVPVAMHKTVSGNASPGPLKGEAIRVGLEQRQPPDAAVEEMLRYATYCHLGMAGHRDFLYQASHHVNKGVRPQFLPRLGSLSELVRNDISSAPFFRQDTEATS